MKRIRRKYIRLWQDYAIANQLQGASDSIGVNYLELCDATIGKEARDAHRVAAGIRAVIRGEIKEFMYDYPCHGPDGRHFYYVRAVRVAEEQPIRVVVSHEDITALKLAEEKLVKREKESYWPPPASGKLAIKREKCWAAQPSMTLSAVIPGPGLNRSWRRLWTALGGFEKRKRLKTM